MSTIILIRINECRNYYDYDNISDALDAFLHMFEEKLAAERPGINKIAYNIDDVFSYVDDGLSDLGVLVYNKSNNSYDAHGKEWFKRSLFRHLKELASK